MRNESGKLIKDITGLRSGRLVAVRFSHMDKGGHGSIWECLCDCGNTHFTRMTHIKQNKTLSCGCFKKEMFDKWREDKHGDKNAMWKGGRTLNKGYVQIITSFKDRFGKPRYKLEHRMIMENYLGRDLEPYEVVHHKNGIKTDNRIENLELLTKNTHKGEVLCPHCQKTFFIR